MLRATCGEPREPKLSTPQARDPRKSRVDVWETVWVESASVSARSLGEVWDGSARESCLGGICEGSGRGQGGICKAYRMREAHQDVSLTMST